MSSSFEVLSSASSFDEPAPHVKVDMAVLQSGESDDDMAVAVQLAIDVNMNDGVGGGEPESCRDRRLDGKDELGAQTRVLMLVPNVGGFDIIVRRREEAGCSDAHRR